MVHVCRMLHYSRNIELLNGSCGGYGGNPQGENFLFQFDSDTNTSCLLMKQVLMFDLGVRSRYLYFWFPFRIHKGKP